MSRIGIGLVVLGLGLGGCGSRADLPSGVAAYGIVPAPDSDQAFVDYELGPLDQINVRVFQEPDLTVEELQIDASGNIAFPLIGQVRAAGRSSTELSQEIAERLGRFLVDPQVSVFVASSVSQKVTVEGQVTDPGVFVLQGQTTLLQALAMAKGPTRVARLGEVVVFRQRGNERLAAMFDVDDIRKGLAADPQILGNDTVVVGLSGGKAAWRDFLSVAPLLTTVFINIDRF